MKKIICPNCKGYLKSLFIYFYPERTKKSIPNRLYCDRCDIFYNVEIKLNKFNSFKKMKIKKKNGMS